MSFPRYNGLKSSKQENDPSTPKPDHLAFSYFKNMRENSGILSAIIPGGNTTFVVQVLFFT